MKSVEEYLAENRKASDERQNVYNPINYLNCKNKVKLSLENAKNKAKELGLFYYKCNICGSYHLTKQQTYESTIGGLNERSRIGGKGMRLEQHISKMRGRWHCHLYMTEEEYEKQPITHITNSNNLNKLIGIPSEVKSRLFGLFHSGLVYVELKKEINK